MVEKLVIKFPKDKSQLTNMIQRYRDKILNDRTPKEKIDIPDLEKNSNFVLENKLSNIINEISSAVPYLKRKAGSIAAMLKTDEHLSNMDDFYKSHTEKLKNNFDDIKDSEDVNKRMVEFYNKDYDSKIFFKKYLKYIYNFIIFILILVLFYKKLHKNKKILLFVAFLLIIPAYLLRMLFDLVMNYIGHFKLDILYSFFMVISVGIGYGGFLIVKKLLKLLQYEKPNMFNKNNTEKKSNKLPSISKNLPSISKNLPSISKNLPSITKKTP